MTRVGSVLCFRHPLEVWECVPTDKGARLYLTTPLRQCPVPDTELAQRQACTVKGFAEEKIFASQVQQALLECQTGQEAQAVEDGS